MSFLYSKPRGERVFDDPVACFEAEYLDAYEDDDTECRPPYVVEKWTMTSGRTDLPDAGTVMEDIIDRMSLDLDEGTFEVWQRATRCEDCRELFRRALDAFGGHGDYVKTDKKVGEMLVTVVDGELLLDGEPMYVPRGAVR